MLFSRNGGYHAFNPEQLLQKKNVHLPDLRITGFRLLDEHIASGSQDILKKPIWQTSSMNLTYDQNVFAISDSQTPPHIRSYEQFHLFRGMVNGKLYPFFQKPWRTASPTQRTTQVAELPPHSRPRRPRGTTLSASRRSDRHEPEGAVPPG